MMTTPTQKKSPEMVTFIQSVSPNPTAWTDEGISTCAICSGPAEVFTDALSAKEYTISRMCQACQDVVFAPDLDEDGE